MFRTLYGTPACYINDSFIYHTEITKLSEQKTKSNADSQTWTGGIKPTRSALRICGVQGNTGGEEGDDVFQLVVPCGLAEQHNQSPPLPSVNRTNSPPRWKQKQSIRAREVEPGTRGCGEVWGLRRWDPGPAPRWRRGLAAPILRPSLSTRES